MRNHISGSEMVIYVCVISSRRMFHGHAQVFWDMLGDPQSSRPYIIENLLKVHRNEFSVIRPRGQLVWRLDNADVFVIPDIKVYIFRTVHIHSPIYVFPPSAVTQHIGWLYNY